MLSEALSRNQATDLTDLQRDKHRSDSNPFFNPCNLWFKPESRGFSQRDQALPS